ncbi:hypothetical protein [Gracilibacillus suaedae]|uniref:hypothetical protein n=1 Tax=Gracilibacillus suaedae TaxID=2820273 RepID=UPI001ABDC13E|nr:hypothetical protein [Gracilibacillus suaedae]
MELVKRSNSKKPKLRETRLSIFSFICALLTLAYFNMMLMTSIGLPLFSNVFLLIVPVLGVISGLLSFTRLKYKNTFAWWSLGLFLFIFVSVVVVGFIELATYTKP